ncbi:arginine deiminase family protein [Rummeliibacillus sp. TYF-LIM-RU47]|uniref:arginine deiminase family protein n=1 Tax=Rummeliibacillus sp. TYF-LIM-RU47 TaxID=2608406 RepID=UPI00123AEB73|nr:arginine deiminase family protein [Rummeliibacillus sp. TYF-LIM-RU47]
MSFCSSMYKPLERVIVKRPEESFINQENVSKEWKRFNYLEEPNYEEAVKEHATFISILKKHVPNIDYLPAFSDAGLDSLYAHDPVKFTSDGAIILKSGKAVRQPEAEAYKEFLREKNIPIIGELTGDAVSDAGDLVWLDERTLAIGLGCVIVEGNNQTKQQLIDAGAEVYEYKGQEISYKGTGGPTCLTCPVVRK